MWDITSGVMLWKLNDCWPSVLWQLYDWYLCQNAAYYYAQKAMEPIHIQMNANNHMISLINATHKNIDSLQLRTEIIDFNMKTVWFRTDKANIGPDTYKEFYTLPKGLRLTSVYFVKLVLQKTDGRLVSDNIYWLSSSPDIDFKPLANIRPVILDMTARSEKRGKEGNISVKLRNNTDRLSFFNRLVIKKGEGGEEVLPSFWDTNFIILFPGEEKTVRVRFAIEDLDGAVPYLSIDGNPAVKPVVCNWLNQ
jgi:exo-1,4-beta-D-glucosaminidase